MWQILKDNPKTTLAGVVAAGLTIALIVGAIDVQGYCVTLGSTLTLLGLAAKDAQDGNK